MAAKTSKSDRYSRREIANMNERKRMENINSSFDSLKALIPLPDDLKLSKVRF